VTLLSRVHRAGSVSYERGAAVSVSFRGQDRVHGGKELMRVHEGRQVVPAPRSAPAAPFPGAPGPPPSGGPDGPIGAPARTGWVPDAIVLVGGLLVLALGLTVMAAWYARVTAILIFASPGPMVFNTALGLAVTGGAMVALARGRPWAVLVAGVFNAALGVIVLAEYRLGRSLGIDQLFVRAYVATPHKVPGMVSVNTATCFAIVGLGLLVWGSSRSRRRAVALAVAGSLIGTVALTALTGYAVGVPKAYEWAQEADMALLTASAMLILALCLLSAAWGDRPARHQGMPGWLPLPAGAVTFGIGGGVSVAAGGAGRSTTGLSSGAFAILAFFMAALVALAVWLAQQADMRRRIATAAAARASAAETAARASESRLGQFMDAMPVGVFILSADGGPGYANHEAELMTARGIVPDPHQLSDGYGAVVAGTNLPYPAERLPAARAFDGQSSHMEDYAIRQPDGAIVSLEIWGSPVYEATGEIEYAITAVADMSDRDAREKIATDQAALLDQAHDAIMVRDQDGRITYWNAGAERTYGFTRTEALGRFAHELLRTRYPEPLAKIEATTVAAGGWEGELAQICADGRSIVVESRWAGQRGPGGSVRYMETNRDITSRKDAEREALRTAAEIRALNASLEQQVQQRTGYLELANKNLASLNYSVAHDLRTPLRGINGFAEALTDEFGDRIGETGRGYAERIQLASVHMARILDDLQYLSEVSGAQIDLQEVDLSAAATAICDQLRTDDPDRRVTVSIEAGLRAVADRHLIVSVLDNLLRNAWKFSAGRHDTAIEFATTTVDGQLCYFVRDNGIGFDYAYADKLFQPFQRLHADGEFAGAGIGLAAVRRIIERHGGRTWASGAVDRGATFYFTLAARPL
jgi:PAS domain S-box-containing protein